MSQTTTDSRPEQRGIIVFSGGSAANSLVDVFNAIRETKSCDLSYVIPISDNGGSSSELIRMFGGPGESAKGPKHQPSPAWRRNEEIPLFGQPVARSVD